MVDDDEAAAKRAEGWAALSEASKLRLASQEGEARLMHAAAATGVVTPVTCGGCGEPIGPGDEQDTWLHVTPALCVAARPAPREPDVEIRIRISPDPHPYVQRQFVESSPGAWAGEVLSINLGEDRAAVGGVRAVVHVPIQSARQWLEYLTFGINRALDPSQGAASLPLVETPTER